MSRKSFFILLLSIHLIPFSAFGSDVHRVSAPQPTPYELDDLSYTELQSTFTDFKVIHRGAEKENNPNTEAYLSGTVFQRCWDKFRITNTTDDESIKTANFIGFRVEDLGGGRDCQKALKSELAKAKGQEKKDEKFDIIRLSQATEAKMSLSDMGDGEIKIIRLDPRADENRVLNEAVPDLLPHVSKTTAARIRKETQEKTRAKEIEKLQHCVATCSGDNARESLNKLIDLGVEVDFDAANKKIALRDLADIEKELAKAKPEDLQSIRERLLAFNDENPGFADTIADAYRRAAKKAVEKKGVRAGDYELAMSMLAEARELEGLSSSRAARFEKDQLDLQVGRMQAIALDGMQNNMVFMPNYYNLMQQLQMNTMQSCNGSGASLEGCSSAMQALRSASAIPQTAQSIDQSRWQMQMQIQQQMQMAMQPPSMGMQMGGQPNTGVPGSVPGNATTFGLGGGVGGNFGTFQNSTPAQGMVWGGGQFGQMSMTPPNSMLGR